MDWEGFFTHYRKPGFIPGYEIVNKLGSGVFGEVYKARKESIGKFYAIKFLKVSDEKISEAIFKELDSLRHFAQIDHPNLVTIEDKGEVMGIPYIVMGYGGDATLKRRLSEGRLDERQVDSIFGQICRGVAALHKKSIIHFDLKPANIFMREDHARVGDYGLSKLVSESHNTMSIGRGTPYYMAPEMLRRRGDHLSDIYSLGVILYEMATGDVPFKGDTEWEVLRKHEKEIVSIPDDVPARYRLTIERAMRKDPAERFPSVEEMLEQFESSEPRAEAPRRATGAAGLPVPPPLPPMARRSTPGRRMARQVRRQVGDLVDRVRRTGESSSVPPLPAGRGPRRDDELSGSFHSDFDLEAAAPSPAPTHDFVTAEPFPVARPQRGAMASFWRMLTWPLRALFRLLGVFFRNFFRYSIVLALTAALCFLIHGAIRGFDFVSL